MKFRSRAWFVLFVLVGLLTTHRLVETIYVGYVERQWETNPAIAEAVTTGELVKAVTAFQQYQSSTHDVSLQLLRDTTLIAALESAKDERDRQSFSFLHSFYCPEDWSIEIYDTASHLIAWKGRSIPIGYSDIDSALAGKSFSTVSQGTVYSYLSVISTLATKKTTAVVVVSRTVEISYPFHNRFLASSGIQELVRKEIGKPVEYFFGNNIPAGIDNRYVAAELLSIDHRPIGIVRLPVAGKAEYIAGIRRTFHQIFGGLVLLFSIALIVVGWTTTKSFSPWRRFIFFSIILWAVRYLLIFFDIPGEYFEYGVFSPLYFGSPFGFGLAQSLGDLLITVTIVLIDVVLFLMADIDTVRQRRVFRSRLFAAVLLIVTPAISS
ncbi:MAG TPA: hypothetical protein VGB38_05555, partial [bacterium]